MHARRCPLLCDVLIAQHRRAAARTQHGGRKDLRLRFLRARGGSTRTMHRVDCSTIPVVCASGNAFEPNSSWGRLRLEVPHRERHDDRREELGPTGSGLPLASALMVGVCLVPAPLYQPSRSCSPVVVPPICHRLRLDSARPPQCQHTHSRVLRWLCWTNLILRVGLRALRVVRTFPLRLRFVDNYRWVCRRNPPGLH